MDRRLVVVAVSLALAGQAFAEIEPRIADRVSASMVKVRVVNESRRVATGSAVAVAKGVLVTSCHGLRQARVTRIVAQGVEPTVTLLLKDVDRDLCFLSTTEAIPPLDLARDDDEPRIGDFVAAFGFTGPEVHFTNGSVKALHPYEGGNIIQTSAAFVSGESGGALVDREGKLVGILTFYASGRNDYFFAVPVGWVRQLLQRLAHGEPLGQQPELSFWERTGRDRPAFLEAAAREYAQDWQGLLRIALEWVEREPRNPQAWLALGKAQHRFRQDAAAIGALKESVRLEPQQPAAWFYLGAACREVNEPEGLREALERLDLLSPEAAEALRGGLPLN
jgi:S1-C subfamily serine protease